MLRFFVRLILLLLALVVAAGAFLWFWAHPEQTAPGQLLAAEPRQRILPGQPILIEPEYAILPIALFQIDGRVLARKDYTLGNEAKFSPLDMVLGWGLMGEAPIAGKVRVVQADRSYTWNATGSGLDDASILRNTANLHLIPATPELREFLAGVLPGEYLSLKGELVVVGSKSGWKWLSSFTREDTGADSGEILYVRKAEKFTMHGNQPVRFGTPLPVKGDIMLQAPLRVRLAHGEMTIPANATVTLLNRTGDKTKGRYNGLEFVVPTRDIR